MTEGPKNLLDRDAEFFARRAEGFCSFCSILDGANPLIGEVSENDVGRHGVLLSKWQSLRPGTRCSDNRSGVPLPTCNAELPSSAPDPRAECMPRRNGDILRFDGEAEARLDRKLQVPEVPVFSNISLSPSLIAPAITFVAKSSAFFSRIAFNARSSRPRMPR